MGKKKTITKYKNCETTLCKKRPNVIIGLKYSLIIFLLVINRKLLTRLRYSLYKQLLEDTITITASPIPV